MSMETLTKAVVSAGKDWYTEQKRYNQENGVETNVLQYFAWKARDVHGVGIEDDRELERRESLFLRRFNVRDGEWAREKRVRQYAHDSWALEEYWKAHGCPWSGPESPTVEKAQTTGPLTSTFPAFIETQIEAGRLVNPILDRLVSDSVNANSGIATHIQLTDTAATPSGAVETMEGARTAQVHVTFQERRIPLKKFGYETLSTYEASRRARLPILRAAYERIGRRFQFMLTEFALDVMILGDDYTNNVTSESGALSTVDTAAGTEAADVAGTPDYDDLMDLLFGFTEGYTPNLGIASGAVLQNLLNIAEIKDSQLFTFARDGNYPSILGIPHIRWDSKGISSGYTNTKLLWVDTSVGLTEYTDGGILTQSEQLISEGWNKTVTTLWVGYAVNDKQGARVGTSFAS